MKLTKPADDILAIRCHDVTTTLAGTQVGDFDQLVVVGMAVRLALHLRGVQAIAYDLLKQVGLHLLHIPPTSLRQVVEMLADVEFIKVDQEGKTIRAIIPTIPFYDDLFKGLGEAGSVRGFSEAEQLTLTLLERLATGPVLEEHVRQSGAESKLVKRMVDTGVQGGYLIGRRARGKDVLLSPVYQPENPDAFADLVAGSGATRVQKVLATIGSNQGWPLSLAIKQGRIGQQQLTPQEINVIVTLAGDGFAAPPSIKTTHAGSNYFIFGPKPGAARLHPTKRPVYEAAMALVAAVRQGQLLPKAYAIRSPQALLRSLHEKKFLRANTEAVEQYRELSILKVGRLVEAGGGFRRFELIERPENIEAVEMAIRLVGGSAPPPAVDDDIVLAFRKGESYMESLVSRKRLVDEKKVELDPDSKREIEDLLLGGVK